MELFLKRPFALMCVLFLTISLLAGYIPVSFLLLSMVCLFIGALLIFSVRSFRRRFFGFALGLAVAFLSLCHSFLLTDLPALRAKELCGKRMVLCEVIEERRSSAFSSTALVLLKNADGESVSVRGELVCDFSASMSVGDQLYAYATVSEYEEYTDFDFSSRKSSGGIFLSIHVEEEAHAQIRRLSERNTDLSMLSDLGGIRILIHRIKNGLRSHLNTLLGEEIGGMATGFFVGDSSGIAKDTMMHFRRSGVVHLLSVSGLHLTILLGAIEWFLRCVLVPKRLRIPIISVFSFLLLILTGFSPSACRSVMMLLIVYFQFMIAEDNDAVTTLFSAIALIVLISPYAVSDLGLWMSFLATLGLLTVYPLWEESLGRIRAKRGILKPLARVTRTVLGGILLTTSANLFLLPILWLGFGEFSLIGLACNVATSFLSSMFLVGIPILLVIGRIPFVGDACVWFVRTLGEILAGIIERFSRIPYGVVSLRYEFASVIVGLLTVTMGVLLVIRLRHKWILGAVPCVAAVVFVLCLVGHGLFFSRNEAVYLRSAHYGETIALQRDHRMAICDLSSGGWMGAETVLDVYEKSVATEVEVLFLTHWHEGHLSMLEYISERVILRRILIPMPKDSEEAAIAQKFVDLASKSEIRVEIYESGKPTRLWDGLSLCIERKSGGKHDALVVYVKGEEEGLLYLSPDARLNTDPQKIEEGMASYETVIIGCHGTGERDKVFYCLPEDAKTKAIVYSAEGHAKKVFVENYEGELFGPNEEKKGGFFEMTLP